MEAELEIPLNEEGQPEIRHDQLHQLVHGIQIPLDGKIYYFKGPLENGARDLPGHAWISTGGNRLFGTHVNSGPFGIPSWWSSDAPDGSLLYLVQARIDTWSPTKSAIYRALGYIHYHQLVTIDNVPHPTKVIYMRHWAVREFNLDGGPRPWLAHEVEFGLDRGFQPNAQFPYPPVERWLYTVAVDKGGADPDMLVVIGADPNDPSTYGKISHRVDLPNIGDEVHHFGYDAFQRNLLVPGLFSGNMHIIDVETDAAHPTLTSWHSNLIGDSGYIVPHTVIGAPRPSGGYWVSMIGANTPSTGPGGIVDLDADAEFNNHFGPGPVRPPGTPPNYMYDIGFRPLRNRMVTTSFGLPGNVGGGITVAGLGDEVNVWDFKNRTVTQNVNIGAGTGALEVRWLHDQGVPIGFTNAPGTSEIWRWSDLDLDGTYDFDVAVTLPTLSVPTDMLLSHDDKFMYIANWAGNSVVQVNIEDPFNPVIVDQVTVPYAQMMRLSWDNTRLYVTNSLLSTWDDTEFPAGVTRNTGYAMYKIDIDHENGGMTIDNGFTVDFDNVQKQSSVGPARPHQTFFDPNIRSLWFDH